MNKFIKLCSLLAFLFLICNPVFSQNAILGGNLEFVNGRSNGLGFDGGFSFQLGYQFKEKTTWQFGILTEHIGGWNNEDDLSAVGDMMYKSNSVFAIAQSVNFPIMLKVGIVKSKYKVLIQDFIQEYREVNKIGYAFGISLALKYHSVRINMVDFKSIRIGNDRFTSIGISLAVFMS